MVILKEKKNTMNAYWTEITAEDMHFQCAGFV